MDGYWSSIDAYNEFVKSIASLAGLEVISIPYNDFKGKQADILYLLKKCKSLKKLSVEKSCVGKDKISEQYKEFTEGFHTAFQTKRFASAWEATYYVELNHFFYAEYTKREEN